MANCYKYASLSSCVNTTSNRSITPNLYGFHSLINVVGLYANRLRTWLTRSVKCRLPLNVAMKCSGELLLGIVVVAGLFLCEPWEVAAQGKAQKSWILLPSMKCNVTLCIRPSSFPFI